MGHLLQHRCAQYRPGPRHRLQCTAVSKSCELAKENKDEETILHSLAVAHRSFISGLKKKFVRLVALCWVVLMVMNGCRQKWSLQFVSTGNFRATHGQTYDLLVCDSKNIEKYTLRGL